MVQAPAMKDKRKKSISRSKSRGRSDNRKKHHKKHGKDKGPQIGSIENYGNISVAGDVDTIVNVYRG